MYTDYKWWYVKRDDSGVITEAAVRFYEGGYEEIEATQVYVRSAKLGASDMPVNRLGSASADLLSDYVRVYTTDDFGTISTDSELETFCNQELAKDAARTPVPEQEVSE